MGIAVTCLLAMGRGGAFGATQAEVDAAWAKGLAWLLTHQRADGSWRSAPGTEVLGTAGALEALMRVNVKRYPFALALAWLSNADTASVDSTARRIRALKTAGVTVTPLVQFLIGWRNTSLAWGAYDRFETSFPDAPLALAALRIAQAGYSYNDFWYGFCAIVMAQKTGDATVQGSWAYVAPMGSSPASAVTSALLPTAVNVLEVNALATAFGWQAVSCSLSGEPLISTVISDGLNWLLTQRRNGGGFGELLNGQVVSTVFATAQVFEALRALRPWENPFDPNTPTGAALGYLIGQQHADGSWNGDAMQTAVVLRVLPLPTGGTLPDSDLDSLPNTVEPLLGTNPTVADSRWLANPSDGDLNQDGVVDAADVAIAQQIASGQLQATTIHLRHGDVSPPGQPDGLIDASDVARIQRKALGEEGF